MKSVKNLLQNVKLLNNITAEVWKSLWRENFNDKMYKRAANNSEIMTAQRNADDYPWRAKTH